LLIYRGGTEGNKKRTMAHSVRKPHFWSVLVSVLSVVTILIAGRPAGVRGEPPSLPSSNTWVTNGFVSSIVSEGGITYIGGSFSYVAPCTGNGVPIDAETGLVLPSYSKFNGPIFAVVPDGTGGWYVGGSFTSVDGVERNGIAHLLPDNSLDTSWNPNADGPIFALAVSNGIVYAGGYFTSIGGQLRDNIAALDAGTSQATPWNPGADHWVGALAASDGTIYVNGAFLVIAGQPRNQIAALDASTGQATPWDPHCHGTVYALAVSGATVYVGGHFWEIGGQPRNNIAALDATIGEATSWDPNASDMVEALATSDGTVYVGGEFRSIGGQPRNYIAAIDPVTAEATSWDPGVAGCDGVPCTPRVDALVVDGETVYVGGEFRSIGGQPRNYIAALDATTGQASSWNPNAHGSVTAIAVSGDTVYAGGWFASMGGLERNNIAALDSRTGEPTPWNPDADRWVEALAVSDGIVYAGGWFTSIGGQARNCIAALDAVTGEATPWNPNADDGVEALEVSENVIYAAGWFWHIGGQRRHYIAALDAATGDATSWNPNANYWVETVAVSGRMVYAGGRFTKIGREQRNYIAALDRITGEATPWNPNAENMVNTLAVSGDKVYAGGDFIRIGGQTRNYIAALDGVTGQATSWNPNPNGGVYALEVTGETVYAGGAFSHIGDQQRNHIAALDALTGQPTSWNPNADAQVYALAVAAGTVYAGGLFHSIGVEQRPSLAQFGINTMTTNPSRLDFGPLTTGSTSLPLTLTVTNLMETDLTIGSILLTGHDPDFFLLESDLCSGNTLAPSGTCTVQVAFTPSSKGFKSALVSIASNMPYAWTFDVPLTGYGRASKVILLSPNGGEVIASGSTYVVSWNAASEATTFRLFYSLDNGNTWEPIAAQAAIKGASYTWQLPKIRGNNHVCRMKAVGFDGSQVVGSDVSDGPFSIEVVKLLSPNGGELFHPGDTVSVEWRTSPLAHHFDLMYSIDNGSTWKLIEDAEGITGTQFTTTILPPATGNKWKCLMKVIAYGSSGAQVGADRSNRPFRVEVVRLTEPNREVLTMTSGDPLTIAWTTYTTAQPIDKITLSYTLNGGMTWKPIISLPADSSSYGWTIPSVELLRTCRVQVVLKDANNVTRGSDTSDSSFLILPKYDLGTASVSPFWNDPDNPSVTVNLSGASGTVDTR
jgi:hypothetical protein